MWNVVTFKLLPHNQHSTPCTLAPNSCAPLIFVDELLGPTPACECSCRDGPDECSIYSSDLDLMTTASSTCPPFRFDRFSPLCTSRRGDLSSSSPLVSNLRKVMLLILPVLPQDFPRESHLVASLRLHHLPRGYPRERAPLSGPATAGVPPSKRTRFLQLYPAAVLLFFFFFLFNLTSTQCVSITSSRCTDVL